MDSYLIRHELPHDAPEISEVHIQAFAQDRESRLVEALREDGNINPELSLVAIHKNRTIAHILFCPVTIVSATGEIPALSLATLGVHQDYQCMGIGAALVEAGLDQCRRLGHGIVIVVGHPGYYPRFGFTMAKESGILPPFPCRDNVFMALPLKPGALDGSGGMVRYPEAFDRVGAHTS
ncbi:MAG: N-acetyltransferase [Methanomicrobiales archaeon]|nr:N-acetyltransferase [Methanomicrobiales archaeon]